LKYGLRRPSMNYELAEPPLMCHSLGMSGDGKQDGQSEENPQIREAQERDVT
jgi:hypothetical protein